MDKEVKVAADQAADRERQAFRLNTGDPVQLREYRRVYMLGFRAGRGQAPVRRGADKRPDEPATA